MLDAQWAAEAVRLTFEEMAFLDVVGPALDETVEESGPLLLLSFTRPRSGAVLLALPKTLRYAVAEAIYGEEARTLPGGKLDDSLLELMNVLAGRLLTARFGTTGRYAMGLPTLVYGTPADLEGLPCQRFVYQTDAGAFQLTWYEVEP